MKHLLSTTVVILALGAMSVSCDKVKPPQPELKPQATEPAASSAQQEQRTFTQTAQKELDALREAIAALKAKAQAAGTESKDKLNEEAQKLEAGLGETQQELEKLKLTTVETWHQVKETFKTSLDKLKEAVKGATKGSS